MDAILFSAVRKHVDVDDAIRHLDSHDELYWSVSFPIRRENFSFPLLGFIHIGGGQVEYKAVIKNIIPFSPEHYENPILAPRVKPKIWITGWKERDDKHPSWKNALVITSIEPFSYDTYKLIQYNGNPVKQPPQKYIRIIPPLSNEDSRDEQGGYLPNKDDIEAAYKKIAKKEDDIYIDKLFDQIEKDFTNSGRLLKNNWRTETESFLEKLQRGKSLK